MFVDNKLGVVLLSSIMGFMALWSNASEALPVQPPRLRVSGKQILDPANKPIILRGWNWGQWDTAVLPDDATNNVRQGANVVRIPLRWWGQWGEDDIDSRDENSPQTGYIKKDFLKKLDDTVGAATKAGLWVDLFVDSNCGQASIQYDTIASCGKSDDKKHAANFLNSASKKAEFIALWKFLVQHYANTPNIGMYEILPEPSFSCTDNGGCSNWQSAPDFYRSMIAPIREIDQRTPIIVGATGGYDLKNIETAYIGEYDGLIYTADILQGGSNRAYDDATYIAPLLTFRTAHQVPVFVQQVGVRQNDPGYDSTEVAKSILQQLNDNKIGWTWWTYREQHANDGYAPWSLNHDPSDARKWLKNQEWLTTITNYFNAITPN